MTTCMPSCENPLYMLFEIASEAGELQGKFAKAIRKGWIEFDDNSMASAMNQEQTNEFFHGWEAELGDILWGIAGLAKVFGIPLEEVAEKNLTKLVARKVAGTIDGNGDGISGAERSTGTGR